jgi:altronate dehydratase
MDVVEIETDVAGRLVDRLVRVKNQPFFHWARPKKKRHKHQHNATRNSSHDNRKGGA